VAPPGELNTATEAVSPPPDATSLVKLRVRFLASLYELAGVLKTEVEVPDGLTVRGLIDVLTEKYAKLREELLDEGGNLKPMYNILVNGRAVEWLGGLDTLLKDGDEVVFIPPAASIAGVPHGIFATAVAGYRVAQNHHVIPHLPLVHTLDDPWHNPLPNKRRGV